MITPAELTFNLIFTKGSPKYLWPFTLSILEHTTVNLRLVANGCTKRDIHFLQDKTETNPRLDLVIYPSKKVQWHDTILNYLLEIETSDYFCFMDTDILATGDFISPFIQKLSDHSAIFSCKPMWSENDILPPDFPRIVGKFIYTTDGFCLGSSYFAMYHKHTLINIIEKYGVNFNRVEWDGIPPNIQHILETQLLKKKRYDTGKILNILFQHDGHLINYFDSDNLYHIGGLSWYISRVKKRITLAREEKKALQETSTEMKKILKLRLNTNQFFYGFIRNLIDKKKMKGISSDLFDNILELEEVKMIKNEITDIYQKYYS